MPWPYQQLMSRSSLARGVNQAIPLRLQTAGIKEGARRTKILLQQHTTTYNNIFLFSHTHPLQHLSPFKQRLRTPLQHHHTKETLHQIFSTADMSAEKQPVTVSLASNDGGTLVVGKLLQYTLADRI